LLSAGRDWTTRPTLDGTNWSNWKNQPFQQQRKTKPLQKPGSIAFAVYLAAQKERTVSQLNAGKAIKT